MSFLSNLQSKIPQSETMTYVEKLDLEFVIQDLKATTTIPTLCEDDCNSEFVFQTKHALSDVDVEVLDLYFNLTSMSTQLMNGKCHRGAREKDFES